MSRTAVIVFAIVVVLFAVSWVAKAVVLSDTSDSGTLDAFLVTVAAFLTLAIYSFLYKDNPYYKFAEHLFVGVSAAFWMCQGFWTTIVGNLLPRLSEGMANWFMQPYQPGGYDLGFLNLSYTVLYWIPVILGLLLLMRLSPKGGWLSRWPLALIIGTTAGLNFVRYLRSDFIVQVSSTFVPLLGQEPHQWQGIGAFFSNFSLDASGQFVALLANWVIFIGVFCGLVYFFFSKEHTGLFGRASRVGIWVLMITFGASFGYTVMGRISLLVGRLTFLFEDWLGLIT
ncbi:MAG: hypothetical protein DRP45_05445 [Candidatus Zixiibacteriota bacterium]|nr:MAG: hypothetical protein DRP45_05445 [candidate division Zixibacteria bacterium]